MAARAVPRARPGGAGAPIFNFMGGPTRRGKRFFEASRRLPQARMKRQQAPAADNRDSLAVRWRLTEPLGGDMQHRARRKAHGASRGYRLLGTAVLLAGLPGMAHALTFSGLQVNSALGEPLSATFELRQVAADESLGIGMASTERFEQLGIPRPALIDRLRLAVTAAGDDRFQVRVDSTQPINEPLFSFLVRVDTAAGGALHEYTALLDPAGSAPPTTRAAAMPAAQPARTDERSGLPATYSVGAGDTLWHIASRYQPPRASVAQTAWAIYKANPAAFVAGPSSLQQEARLRVPDAATIRTVSRQRARTGLQTSPAETRSTTVPAPAASGEAPPPPEMIATTGNAGTPPTAASGSDSPETAGPVDAPNAAFGTLILDSATPWPEAGTPADTPATTALTPSPTNVPAQQTSTTTAPAATAPVRRETGPGLLRPRNIVAVLGLFLLAMLWLRQRDKNEQNLAPAHGDTAGEHRPAPGLAAGPTRHAEPEKPAWLTGTASPDTRSPQATADQAYPAGPAAAGDGPSAPLPETDAPAPRAPLHPAAADASSAVPGLTFQPTTIRPVERRHDRGIADDNVAFDGAAGGERKSPSDAVSMPDEIEGKQDARESTVDLIDPEAFDLYDTPSPDTDAGSPATDDSISIRLDLARMYIDMSDPESARELLLDVKAHGDAAQRAHAERLLGEI
ncbi:MAG: hypothetical protein CMP08_05760 [Xanthomonadales bacterium]|nr:hypothetical protein [Xanthomonadales bacterium]